MTATGSSIHIGFFQVRSDAYLPLELVHLWGSIMRKEPAPRIAQRAECIARAYEERRAPTEQWDADRREIVKLLNETADYFRRHEAVTGTPQAVIGGDSSLRRTS